jgi:uncharacterized protein YndB with AHSA1/START domain
MNQSNPGTEATATVAHPELTMTRVYDAPREVVFRAWTDPQGMARWWGPKYFTNPVCEMDVRPGGALLIHMQGPDGVVYPMKGEFMEVVEPEKLVFTASALDDEAGEPQLVDLTTITFEDLGGKTRLTVNAVVTYASPAAAGALSGMEEGWSQSLDKLEDLLANL